MNKKKLSVVMAGAMLATSVAPVLAAEVTAEEVKMSEKSLLAKKVVDLAKTKMISTNAYIKDTAKNLVDSTVSGLMVADASAYGIKVLDKDGKEITNLKSVFDKGSSNTNIPAEAVVYNVKGIEDILTSDELVEDMTVQVVERKTTEFLGQIIPGTQIEATGKVNTYAVSAFASESAFVGTTNGALSISSGTEVDGGTAKDYVKSVKVNDAKTGATITLNAVKDLGAEKEENVTIALDTTKNVLNFNLPLNKDGKITDKVQECVGFADEATTYQKSVAITADPEVKSAYKMVDDSKKTEKETLLASDLYDGLALTAKGTEIQADLKNAKEVAEENNRPTKATVQLSTTRPDTGNVVNGVASFTVTYYESHKDVDTGVTAAKKIITVKSTNLKEIQSLYDMLTNGNYTVGIVGGDNRYETAVNVAKQQGVKKLDVDSVSNIVLVNGTSLVDGLAASPLAAKLGAYESNNTTGAGTKKSAPLLLTNADSLPTATKEYLVELTKEIPAEKLKTAVKINLVGGETVLSESLVDELKEMGFSVERFGGDNREETSLEVARGMGLTGNANALFVVGANGEADAMSIASEASKVAKQTPIIVAKAGGLTKNAVRFIKTNASGGDVDVIGGESVFSKEDYEKIDEVVTAKVDRVAGSNRFETNAEIIKKYASDITEVILVKDGVSNKNELIDALSAANYAAGKPIVLATDKITESQKVAVLDGKDAGGFTKLTQIGQGVARTTLEAVAEFLGLSNVK